RMPPAAAKPSFQRIALAGKPNSAEVEAALGEMRRFLAARGCTVVKDGASADLAIVIGGDGAMLSAARDLVRHRVPLVGINQGRVGFMTDIGYHDRRGDIGAILDGEYTLEERTLLDAEVFSGSQSLVRPIALNEAVVG